MNQIFQMIEEDSKVAFSFENQYKRTTYVTVLSIPLLQLIQALKRPLFGFTLLLSLRPNMQASTRTVKLAMMQMRQLSSFL